MKAWIPLTLVFALGSAAHAQADCTYPRAPDSIPDGNTASKEEMIAAKNEVSRYNTEMNAYLDCIKLEIDAATPKDPSKLSKDEKAKARGTGKDPHAEKQCRRGRAPGDRRPIQRSIEGLQGQARGVLNPRAADTLRRHL